MKEYVGVGRISDVFVTGTFWIVLHFAIFLFWHSDKRVKSGYCIFMDFRKVVERIVSLEAMQELGRAADIWEKSQST